MRRRPVCLVCLFLMLCMYILDLAGVSLVRGNPLPDKIQLSIRQHPEAVICGEVQQCRDTEYSFSVYLKHVLLIRGSAQIPIKNIKVYLNNKEELPAGTVVQIKGKLEEVPHPSNPGEFDSQQYYACQHIYYFMKNGRINKKSRDYNLYQQGMLDLREKICTVLKSAAGSEAGIYEAMLLGEKQDLSQELKSRYQMAGIIHILAISGLHISILGMGLFQLLKKAGAGNFSAGMLSLLVMLQYGSLTGGSVSALRAICMFLIAVGARILGRSYDLLTAMALSAVLMLLDSPAYLYSSSFQLSFGAVTGLGVVAPMMEDIFRTENLLLKSFRTSLAVQLTTLPLVLLAYGEVSVAGIFLNLLILPTVGIVLCSGLGCCITGFLSLVAAGFCALPGHVLLEIYEKLCMLVAGLPFCTWIAGAPELWQSVLYYVLLTTGLITGNYIKQIKRKSTCGKVPDRIWAGRFCCLLFLGMGIWLTGYHSGKNMTVTCLDIGQGDGIVITVPEGGKFLLDLGSTSKKNTARYQLLPFLKHQGISVLDGVMISHTDQDHINGVEELLDMIKKNLCTVRIKNLILPDWKEGDEAYRKLELLAGEAGVLVWKVHKGQKIKTAGAVLAFLSPDSDNTGKDTNEDGMVMELSYGKFRGLFTGDIGETTEKKLLPVLDDVDFLKVGHHGSRYSSCREFLDVIQPELAFISCSSTNTYGHPSEETIKRLENKGTQVEYTMKNGALTVYTDGLKIWLEKYKQ